MRSKLTVFMITFDNLQVLGMPKTRWILGSIWFETSFESGLITSEPNREVGPVWGFHYLLFHSIVAWKDPFVAKRTKIANGNSFLFKIWSSVTQSNVPIFCLLRCSKGIWSILIISLKSNQSFFKEMQGFGFFVCKISKPARIGWNWKNQFL